MARTNKRKQELLKYLRHGFIPRHACALAGVSRATYYLWLKKDPRFAQEVEHARALPFVNAELAIQKAIAQGNLKAAMWLLERRVPEYHTKAITAIDDDDYQIDFEVIPSTVPDFEALLQQALQSDTDKYSE